MTPAASRAPQAPLPLSAAAEAPAAPTLPIETRYGRIEVSCDAIIGMPNGILGFAGHSSFALIDLPDGRLGQFRLLQSLQDPDLSFLVMPLDPGSGAIDRADLDEARRAAGAAAEDAAFLLIVTLRKEKDGIRVTANLRAPIVLDKARRIAGQYVLSNNRYSIRHALQQPAA